MSLLGYHGFNNWENHFMEDENERDNILFGFELEAREDTSNYIENQLSPEQVACKLEEEFGNLFVYERDSSIGRGVEIISQPMTMNYYMAHIDLFKKLLKMLDEMNYVSTKGNKCGLHIHFNRKALGYNSKEFETLKNKVGNIRKANNLDHERANETISNIVSIMEVYKDELIKISGRNQSSVNQWCSFETANGTEIKEIKRIAKHKNKCGGGRNERYRVVNTTNEKTVEIRLCRGTLMWESFNTRIHLMYNIVNIARNLQALVTLKKLIMYKNNWETIHMMNKYIEEQNTEKRRININEVSKTILLSSKDKDYLATKLDQAESTWYKHDNNTFFKTTFITSWIGASFATIPTYENTRVFAELGTSKLNTPSKSVTVPVVVPLTITDAPIIGSLSSAEITVPVTFVV